MSQRLLNYLEKTTSSYVNDYALKVILSNYYFINKNHDKAILLLNQIVNEAVGSEYSEYAKFTINAYSNNNNFTTKYKSYDHLAQVIFEKQVPRNWESEYISEYLSILKQHVYEKWAPFSFIELLEYYFNIEDFKTTQLICELVNLNYPRSWWDAKACVKILDIDYVNLILKIRKHKELIKIMEFKRNCGALQDQNHIDEKLTLENEINESIDKFENDIIHLAQKYKNFKITRELFFKLTSIFEEVGNKKDIMRVLSHVKNTFGEYPEGAKAHFQLGMQYFKDENYQMALQYFMNYYNDYNHEADIAQATFMIGKTLQMQNRFKEAIDYFKKTLDFNDLIWSSEASNSALEICKQFYNAKQYVDALNYLNNMRTANFNEIHLAEAAYIEGQCNRELSIINKNQTTEFLKKAINNFNHVIERYPNTVYATLSKVTLDEIQSGKLNNTLFITKISNYILYLVFFGFIGLFIVSYLRMDEPFFYFTFYMQSMILILVLLVTFVFKFFSKIYEILFG